MLLRNLNPVVGLCNGTRLVVRKLGRRVLECEIMGGSFAGRIHLIPRITLTNEEFGFKLSRRQFPVRLAFGMTINKSQGQSLNYVGLDLRSPAFSTVCVLVESLGRRRLDDAGNHLVKGIDRM